MSELLSETLVEACKEAGLKATGSKIKCKSQNKWLDKECKTENDSRLLKNSEGNRDDEWYFVDGRNRSVSAKACLISICRKLQRDLAKNRKNLYLGKEKHMELKQ